MKKRVVIKAEFSENFKYDCFVQELKTLYPDYFEDYLLWDRSAHYTVRTSNTEIISGMCSFFKKYNLEKTDKTFDHPGFYHLQTSSKYDESDFDSAELFSLQTKSYYDGDDEEMGEEWGFQIKLLKKFRKYNFQSFIQSEYNGYMLVTSDFKETFLKQNFKGFDLILAPIIEKGKLKKSADLFLVKPIFKLDFEVKRLRDAEGFLIPQFFDKDLRPYLENDFLMSGGIFLVSKSVYSFFKNNYGKLISSFSCYQVK